MPRLPLAVVLGLLLVACAGPAATPGPATVIASGGASGAPAFPTLPPEWTSTATLIPRPTGTPIPTATPRPTRTPPGPGGWAPTVIGYSVEGRPLEVYQFGLGPLRRLIVAGIHGGYEWNTIALADELMDHLARHTETVPPEMTLYVLRSLNPDGEARSTGEAGRYNARRVDINRNFPVNWKYDFIRTGCRDQTPGDAGPRPASEPETRALMQFVQAYRPDALVSYHSAALGIFAGGQPSAPASVSLAEAIDAVSSYRYPPLDTGCEYTGQLADWAASVGLAAIDLELHTHESTDFAINLEVLRMFLAWRP